MNDIEVVVISLPNSVRVQNLINQLSDKFINFKIINAINGNNTDSQVLNNSVNKRAALARLGYSMSPSLLACALSHKLAYENFLNSNKGWALIFEEDAKLTKDFQIDVINQITIAKSSHPTIIQLFSRGSRMTALKSWIKVNETYFEFKFLPRISGFGASAYLINRLAAKIATDSKLIDGPPDFPSWNINVNFFGIYPWMIQENEVGSQIETISLSRFQIWSRRFQIIFGLHYLKFRKYYISSLSYCKEEILPLIYFFMWKIRGSRHFSDKNSPQII